ncbi:MAG: ABC transporter ATP-binding protein [Brevinematales bacterium]|nr:ABC transporter ATP-binding protein [Brevinematales bacterium]
MESVIVENLTKTFGNFVAVDNISFSVKKGEIFAFLGPNGAGKTTTIKMLCGIITPTSGKGTVSGFDIIREQAKIKQNIGYMSQKFSLYDDMTIEENLKFFGTIYDVGKDLKKQIEKVLKFVEIEEKKSTLVNSLPQGIKQRLALAAAVLHNPSILFLDEPTSGVDPMMRRKFWGLIYNFAEEGKTIFVTTHYMDEAEYAKRISFIANGKLIALDTPKKLKENFEYNVYQIFYEDYLKLFNQLFHWEKTKEVALFGKKIHLITYKNVTEKEITNFISTLNYSNIIVEKIIPSLEDVFVTRVKKNTTE